MRLTGYALTVLAVIATASACAGRRGESPAGKPASTTQTDTGFAKMQTRGAAVMGVDQEKATHTFDDLKNGGRIQLASDTGEKKDVDAIRAHLRAITAGFKKGDFSDPAMVHAGAVPGTDVMAAKAARIEYTYRDVARGGVVVIASADAAAVSAIHSFLEFQRMMHRAHGMSGH